MQPWKKIKEETVYKNYREVEKRTFQLSNGKEADFEIYKSANAICILAFDEAGQAIMVNQYRPGPEKILMEIPGGSVDPGEKPEASARRELLEETGYEAGTMEFVGTSLHSAYSTLRRYNFVATNCKKVAEPTPCEHEEVEVILISKDELFNHLKSGELSDTTTGLLGLQHLGLLEWKG